MIEKKLFHELPGGRNSFHTAVLTSFSFNFHHFEYQVLKTLRSKWISSVTVLVDQRMLDDVLGYASDNLKQLSQSYSVVGIKSIAAFHPKINFLIGDDKVLMLYGSGNITPGGHGKNHELFTGLYVDKDDQAQLPLIIEAWNYLLDISDDIAGYNRNRLFNEIPGTCKWMKSLTNYEKHNFSRIDEKTDIALLYNDDTTIFQQLSSLIPANEISKISIVCPYYDHDGESINNLQLHFPNATIDVYLQKDFGLPPVGMAKNNAVNFFAWENTKRGKETINSSENYIRKIHSKIFHFQSQSYEYCIIGSANATLKALGSMTKKSSNEEFSALYRTSKHDFLKSIGIKGAKKKVKLNEYKPEENTKEENQDKTENKSINITSADLLGSRLRLFFKVYKTYGSSFLNIFDGTGRNIYNELIDLSDNSSTIVQLTQNIIKLNPGYIEIRNKSDETISNKQTVNNVNKLMNTDPTKGNRNIQQILNAIDGGSINEFEIIEFINNLQLGNVNNDKLPKNTIGPNSREKDNKKTSATEMTYEDAINAAKNNQEHEGIIQTHSSTRLWESISLLLNQLQAENSDELMDEEEEADAKTSRDRKISSNSKEPFVVKNQDELNKLKNKLERLVGDYINGLTKVVNLPEYEIDTIDLSQFLLVSHIFNTLCNFSEYRFNQKQDLSNWQLYLTELFSYSMIDVLNLFAKTCVKFDMVKYVDNEYQQLKLENCKRQTIYHFWIYLYLVHRKSNDYTIEHRIELLGLNMIYFFGKPDNGFESYVTRMFTHVDHLSFDPDSIIKLQKKIFNIFNSTDFQEKHILLDHSGICEVIRKEKSFIIYKSLYTKNKISLSGLKKHKKFDSNRVLN